MKFKSLILPTAILALSLLATPVWADEQAVQPTVTSSTIIGTQAAEQPKVKQGVIQKRLDAYNKRLVSAQTRLANLQKQLQLDIQKEKDKRDSASQILQDKEAKWTAELSKMITGDQVETAALNADIVKWTAYHEKMKTELTNRLAEIDSNLQKDLSNLDTKIAGTNDQTLIQKYTDMKTTAQSAATARKDVTNKYLTTLQGIWNQRQNVWDARKDLLIQRQNADLNFRKGLIDARRTELGEKVEPARTKTDQQIEQEVTAKYQKRIDTVNSLIQKIQANINKLTVQ